MARARIISVAASNPEDVPSAKPVIWKIGDNVPGSSDMIVQQLVLFNGGVTVFAVPSPGSKTELNFIQNMGSRHAFIFNLAAATIKMTVGVASMDAFNEILRDTYDNADDNFDEEPDDGEEEVEEEEGDEENEPVVVAPPAPPAVAPTPQPSYLPSAEALSGSLVGEDSP